MRYKLISSDRGYEALEGEYDNLEVAKEVAKGCMRRATGHRPKELFKRENGEYWYGAHGFSVTVKPIIEPIEDDNDPAWLAELSEIEQACMDDEDAYGWELSY